VSDGHAPSASGIHPVIAHPGGVDQRVDAADPDGAGIRSEEDASMSSSVVLPEPFGPTRP
jgi:hypothetical protein